MSPLSREYAELFEKYIEGSLSACERAQLAEALAAAPELQREFLKQLDMAALLATRFGQGISSEELAARLRAELSDVEAERLVARLRQAKAGTALSEMPDRRQQVRLDVGWLVCSALSVAATVLLAFGAWRWGGAQGPERPTEKPIVQNLKIKGIRSDVVGVRLDFDTVPGVRYEVFWSPNLGSKPDWQSFAQVVGEGGTAGVVFTNVVPEAYFQVRAVL